MKKIFPVICFSLLSQIVIVQPLTLDKFIADYAKEHNFNGSILVQKNGKVGYSKSFGMANFPFRVPNTPQTKFKIASITKAFTAVLILQLVEQGKIDVNKTIKTYLPDYSGEGGDKVTIHQLLNHTSGIANFDTVKSPEDAINNGLPNYQTPYTTDQLLKKFSSGPLAHVPGKVFDYNNADYIILGKIIERVTGKTYEQVLKDKIITPLNLANTGMLHQSTILDGLADTYFVRDDLKALANDLPVYMENWYAAGGMYSTTNDVLSFSNALFGGKLLKKESVDLMIKPGLDDYGYGVWTYETNIREKKYRVVKRPGSIMGAQTQLYHFLDEGITIVILSNTGTTDLDKFVAEIGKNVIE